MFKRTPRHHQSGGTSRVIAARPVRPAAPVAWWEQRFRDHPVATISSIASIVGGLLLLCFFCQLGRVPDLDLAGASSILFAVAIVGVALAFGLTACAIGVGLMMRADRESVNLSDDKRALGMLVAPGILGVLILAILGYVSPQSSTPSWLFFGAFALQGLLAVVFARMRPGKTAGIKPGARWARTTRGFAYASVGYFWIVTALTALVALFAVFPRDGLRSHFAVAMVGWTLWCYTSNLVVAKVQKVNVFAVMAGCVVASLAALLWLAGNWVSFPRAIIASLGLGEVPVALVVTAEGCDHLNKAIGGAACRLDPGEKTAVVCPAVLRSRIGSPYFVELSPYDAEGHWPMLHPPERLAAIAIPKAEAPTWTQLAPMSAASSASGPARVRFVTYLDSAEQGSWIREQCGPVPAASAASASAVASVASAASAPSSSSATSVNAASAAGASIAASATHAPSSPSTASASGRAEGKASDALKASSSPPKIASKAAHPHSGELAAKKARHPSPTCDKSGLS